MRQASKVFLLLLIPLGLTGIWMFWKRFSHGPKPPFEVSFWVWQGPFAFSDKDVSQLKELGVSQLFVRAGTFTSDGEHVYLTLPQRWDSKARGLKIHLVFNFDAGVVAHFSHYDLRIMADDVRRRIEKQISEAEKAGIDVGGVQFDFDVPTSKLNRYADFIRRVREDSAVLKRGERIQVSATALITWLHSSALVAVSRELNFLAPQFYEGFTGPTLDRMSPISDLESFRKNVSRADALACPYYVGVPAYGHALLYDEVGRLTAMYSGLKPADALRHPSFQVEAAYPCDRLGHPAKSEANSVGEEILKLKAIRADRNGHGLDNTLAYAIPTPTLLQRYLAEARSLQSDRCLGAIIYRYPESGQSLALPFPTVQAILTSKPLVPHLKIVVKNSVDNYDLVEQAQKATPAPMDVYLEVTNDGNAPSFVGPDAVVLGVAFDQPGFDAIRRRDMDSVAQIGPSSLELRKGYIAPGQSLQVGPIRLVGEARAAKVTWRIRAAEGFKFTSGSSQVNLASSRR